MGVAERVSGDADYQPLKAIGDTEGELMSSLQIHAWHDSAGCLGHTEVNRELRGFHSPASERKGSRRYDPHRIGERGGYDCAGEAFNLSRLLHHFRAQEYGAPSRAGEGKSECTESPAVITRGIARQAQQRGIGGFEPGIKY